MVAVSDDRLRTAERRWRETGDVADEARLLLERVRAGELTRERLELAAYSGHAGARVAVPDVRSPAPDARSPRGSQAWIRGLARFGPVVELRAGLHAGRLILHHGFGDRAEPLFAASMVWVACPCDPHAAEVGACAVANAGMLVTQFPLEGGRAGRFLELALFEADDLFGREPVRAYIARGLAHHALTGADLPWSAADTPPPIHPPRPS